jgi:hypothetical protein
VAVREYCRLHQVTEELEDLSDFARWSETSASRHSAKAEAKTLSF